LRPVSQEARAKIMRDSHSGCLSPVEGAIPAYVSIQAYLFGLLVADL